MDNLTFFDDLARRAIESGEGILDETASRVLSIDNVRIGSILSMLSIVTEGEEDWMTMFYYVTAIVAAVQAVIDFNQRRSPFVGENLAPDCSFYLQTWLRGSIELQPLGAAKVWQDEVLFHKPTSSNPLAPMGVIGPTTSAESLTVATLGGVIPNNKGRLREKFYFKGKDLQALQVPLLSPSATSSLLSSNAYSSFARTIPSDLYDAKALCVYLSSGVDVHHLGVLYTSDTFGPSFAQAFDLMCPSVGVTPYLVAYNAALSGSLSAAIDLIKQSELYYYFVVTSRHEWRNTIINLYDSNLLGNPDYVWFFSSDIRALVTGMFDGGWIADEEVHRALNNTGTVGVQLSQKAFEIAEKRWNATFADEEKTFWKYFASRVANETGFHETPLESWFEFFQILTPTTYSLFAYDAVLAMGLAACQAEEPFFSGDELYESLVKLNFTGATGTVTFDETGTRRAAGLVYSIENIFVVDNSSYTYTVEAIEVHFHDEKNNVEIVTQRPFTFPSGLDTPPRSLPPHTEHLNLVPLGVRIFCWVLASIVILASIGLAVWSLVRREHPQVKASQPVFLVLLCGATLQVACATITATLQEPTPKHILDAGCMATEWLLGLGTTLAFSTLFTKTWRINQVYRSAQMCRRVVIRPRDVLGPMLALLSVYVTILTCWTILDPLVWTRTTLEEDRFGRPISSVGMCNKKNKQGGYSFLSSSSSLFDDLLWLVTAVAIAILFYQCYRARTLPSQYNESKQIFIAGLVLFEAFLIGTPVLWILSLDYNAAGSVATRCVVYTVFSLGILIPIFLPKFTKEQDEKQKRHVSSVAAGGGSSTIVQQPPPADLTLSSSLKASGVYCPKNYP